MRKLLPALLILLFVGPLVGCGSEKERGQYKNQDRPRSDDKEKDK
jgi:hypothetical protein